MNYILVQSTTGDREGLYVRGQLVAEGHRLSALEVLEALKLKPEVRALSFDKFPATVGELEECVP